MKERTKKRLKRSVALLLFIYILGGILLYLVQDMILFHPTALPKTYSFSFQQPFRELNIPFENRNLNIVQFTVASNRKGIVLYFHGNKSNIERYALYALSFTRQGYEVWMMDYPGFGKSTGKRTEQIMYADAGLLYQLAIKEVSAEQIIIYGRSLGTGIAAQAAARFACKQLMLEAPYYNIPSLAQNKFPIYPIRWLVRYSFPINAFLPKVTEPVTIFHGTRDEVIPYSQAQKLKEENPAVQLVTIPNGKHNNLAEYQLYRQMLDSLLRR